MFQEETVVLIEMPDRDVVVDIEHKTSAIQTTLPDMTQRIDAIKPFIQDTRRQLSEQLKQENVAGRNAIESVGNSVTSLSGRFDQGAVKIQQDFAATSTTYVSTLRTEAADQYDRMFQEMAVIRDTVKNVDMALRALPSREELGRLIAKPSQLKELCNIMEETPERSTPRHASLSPHFRLARRACICRKRLVRSKQALLWGPWRALAETSITHHHLPDCIYYRQGAEELSTRWAVAFTGLQKLVSRAIEVSFSYSLGAGGCSLSPGFTHYPTIDHNRDPAFRIIGLMNRAIDPLTLTSGDSSLGEFVEKGIHKIILLYRRGKASTKAVDLYGRGVLHHFGFLVRYSTCAKIMASFINKIHND